MNIKLHIKAPFIIACLLILNINLIAQNPNQILNNAIKLIELEKFETAKTTLNSLKNTKKAGEAYFYIGLCYLANFNFEDPNISLNDAKDSFTKGITTDGKLALNYVGLGTISLEENRKEEAENYFLQALKLNNSYLTNLYIGKAYAYTSNGDLQKAINYLKKSIKQNRKYADSHLTLGDAYLKNRDPNNSILEYKYAEDINPSYYPTYLKQSNIYKYARNYKAAIAPLNYIISRDPNYLPVYRYLAELYASSNQIDKALDVYKNDYLPKTDGTCNDKMIYAKFLFQASKYKESLDLLKDLQGKCNLKPVFYRFWAYSAYNAQEYNTADNAINTLLSKENEIKVLTSDYTYKSNIALAVGNLSESKSYANKAIEKSNNNPEVISDLAKAAFNFKHYDQALNLYSRIDNTKLNVQDLYYIGLASYLNKDYKRSENAFTSLVEKQPNYVTAWTYLGYIKSREETKKFTGAAKPFFDKVIELAANKANTYKDELVNAYQYMGQYELEINRSPNGVRKYMQKILEIDPNNKQAKRALDALNKAAKQIKQNN